MLSDDAMKDLKTISTMTPDIDSAQLARERFFKKFGSHVNRGPLKFLTGGNVLLKVLSSKKQKQ